MAKFPLTVVIFALTIAVNLQAQDAEQLKDNWHHFRGPTGNGISETATPPTEWSSQKNVKWKVAIPGSGTGSPVIWDDKIFVITAIPTGSDGAAEEQPRDQSPRGRRGGRRQRPAPKPHQFVVMCFDRESGEQNWKQVAVETTPHSSHHQDHGYASSSPVTDGEHLYVSFGSQGIYCYDFDGRLVWKRTDLGRMTTRGGFGEGSSLAIYGNVLILPWDHEGQSRLEVIDKTNGETKWKVDRDEPSAWCSPRVVVVNSRPQVVHGGQNYMRGYDLENGDELWRASGLSQRPVATPVVFNDIAYFASSRQGSAMRAVKLGGSGDVTSDGIAWQINKNTPDCPSLLLSDDRLYFLSSNRGILSCANAQEGSLMFGPERLGSIQGVYSSPVAADGKVYITGRGGKTVVIKDSNEFEVIEENDIGEPVDATIALAGNQLFIRGQKHLFCIEQ